jgi:hypothetical protein
VLDINRLAAAIEPDQKRFENRYWDTVPLPENILLTHLQFFSEFSPIQQTITIMGNTENSQTKAIDRRSALALASLGAAGVLLTSTTKAKAENVTPVVGEPKRADVQPTAGPPPPQIKNVGVAAMRAAGAVFDRPAEQQAKWNQIKQQIDSTLAITSDQTLTGPLNTSAQRIEFGFTFARTAQDDDFTPLHIEPLIDQAADLLDRCLRDRNAYDENAAKMLQLSLELGEYKELDAIHAEEERNQIYEVPAKQSSSEAFSENIAQSYQDWLKTLTGSLLNSYYSLDKINEISGWYQLSAVAQGMVPYWWKNQDFAGFLGFSWNGVTRLVYEHWKESAFNISQYNSYSQARSIEIQKGMYEAAAAVAKARAKGLDAKATWDNANVQFQLRRTLVARKFQDLKAKAAVAEDGVLNYGKRLPALRERFHRDFRDALARIQAISQGLSEIYGYAEPLPTNEQRIDFYDDCLLWTRNAIQLLIRFSRRDQNVIWPISIRESVGDAAWHSGIKSGRWNLTLSEQTFPNMRHLRLQGISATVIDEDPHNLRRIEVAVPSEGLWRHLDGSIGKLSQKTIPPCIFARVAGRNARREPDVIGLTALHNASPIGVWQVSHLGSLSHPRSTTVLHSPHDAENPQRVLNGHSPPLHDICLDLHLTYRRADVGH